MHQLIGSTLIGRCCALLPLIWGFTKTSLPFLFLSFTLAGCGSQARMPVLLSGTAPKVPAAAMAMAQSGWVVVRYSIDASGQVVRPRIVESIPAGVFDATALAAVASWRFQPPQSEQLDANVVWESKLSYRFDSPADSD